VVRAPLLLLAFGAAIPAIAAPPPPPLHPDDLPRVLDGYDVAGYYSRYSYWLEAQKGPVIDVLMAEIPAIEGYRALDPIVGYRKFVDYGHYQSGEIRSYCRVIDDWRSDPSDCLIVSRKINIPFAVLDDDGPLGKYMRQSFDPAKLVAGLKAKAVARDADLWRAPPDAVFASLGSPVPSLRENAQITQVDSAQCPAMRDELTRLETREMRFAIDMTTVADDRVVAAPPPHSVRREDFLRLRTATGFVTVTGDQRSVYAHLAPVYAAIDACEAAQAKSRLPTVTD
jgi:hypothetical protein